MKLWRPLFTTAKALAILCAVHVLTITTIAAEGDISSRSEMVDRLVVKWRTDVDGDALHAAVESARKIAIKRRLHLNYLRRGALGTHVLQVDKPLAIVEMEALAREIATGDKSIEYVEVDGIMRAMSPGG
jgi:hypothetical protein